MSDKARILLVDDEPSVVRMVQRRLANAGYEVLVAMDGQEALRKGREEKPDLIILDLMLPKLNGYEVCATLKQDPEYQKIPVVIFTAKVQERDEKAAMECGADAYVRKPFRAEELLEQIRSLLGASLSKEGGKA